MTTPTERDRGHLADLMHAVRPDFDIAGCVAALREVDPAIALSQLVIAAMRYCDDPANLTPAHLADITNRAWDSDWYVPCKVHPEQRARRTSGECASCAADRLAVTEPLPLSRPGIPIPSAARELMLAAFHHGGTDDDNE